MADKLHELWVWMNGELVGTGAWTRLPSLRLRHPGSPRPRRAAVAVAADHPAARDPRPGGRELLRQPAARQRTHPPAPRRRYKTEIDRSLRAARKPSAATASAPSSCCRADRRRRRSTRSTASHWRDAASPAAAQPCTSSRCSAGRTSDDRSASRSPARRRRPRCSHRRQALAPPARRHADHAHPQAAAGPRRRPARST